MDFPWAIWLAIVGAIVPAVAFLWEFVIVGRKRLGYRVQMDTTASDAVDPRSVNAGAWSNFQAPNDPGAVPSFVLLRVENYGTSTIDRDDYLAAPQDLGLQVRFPGRRVTGLVITDLSDPALANGFPQTAAMDDPKNRPSAVRMYQAEHDNQPVGTIELPPVAMNRGQHYKVLVSLSGAAQHNGQPGNNNVPPFPPPEVIGSVRGGIMRAKVEDTTNHAKRPQRAYGLVGFLVLVLIGQLLIMVFGRGDPPPLDCARGNLTLTGSTAFTPVARAAADTYAKTCPGSHFSVQAQGSEAGLETVDANGRKNPGTAANMLAFSDGEKRDNLPQLLPRPIAFSLFTPVINPSAGVRDLTLAQIRQLYQGKITNWRQVGGNNQPVRLIGRDPSSGTRKTFQEHVLGGTRELASNSDDCVTVDPGGQRGVVRCEKNDTDALLDAVARIPGAIGYSELGAAAGRTDVQQVHINGYAATLRDADAGVYPFWQTEYAYSYGELPATSLAASFLRYLTDQVGTDVVRSFGDRPCSALDNPVRCRPQAADAGGTGG